MLVAMAVTLLIMAAVVTVFANVTSSVSNRRATIEMSSALRNVRETLARDLAGATCPTLPWRRPEANEGYLEILEGPQNDYYPSPWLWDGADADALPDPISTAADALPGIDLTLSSLPGSNLRAPGVSLDEEGRGLVIGSGAPLPDDAPTDGRGLGDADDILMLTVRNESEPFVGRIPSRELNPGTRLTDPADPTVAIALWDAEQIDSPLAEVVWFALENPVERRTQRTFAFGEPGFRTIYRRALLILPELDYGIKVPDQNGDAAGPGVVRVLPNGVNRDEVADALAALIAFQDRYDLSVRLEWNPLLAGGRWVIRANTLGDLTKRENRYEHHGLVPQPSTLLTPPDNPLAPASAADRYFPFAAYSAGSHSGAATRNLVFVADPEVGAAATANFRAITAPDDGVSFVRAYEPDPGDTDLQIVATNRRYLFRPLVVINDNTDTPATARAVLNEDGNVVHVTRGMAPLGGPRRGEDVMMTDALAFDVRVYDPGAPTYAYYLDGDATSRADAIVQPGDPAWDYAYDRAASGTGFGLANPFLFERQGAYVDLGYGRSFSEPSSGTLDPTVMPNRFVAQYLPSWQVAASGLSLLEPSFGIPIDNARLRDGWFRLPTRAQPLSSLVAVYDTWSLHYENNGLNEDADFDVAGRAMVDEGVNGLDDRDPTIDAALNQVDSANDVAVFGPDDPAERETRPPYESALRGLQVTLRAYERDSRQIREVTVPESFVPE